MNREVIDSLLFSEYGESETAINITQGKFAGIAYKYGAVWFPEENEPNLSYQYDLLPDHVVSDEDLDEFRLLISQVLHEMIVKSIEEQKTVFAGGTNDVPVEEPIPEKSAIMTPWDYKVPEPEAGTQMSRNIFNGFN